MNTPKTVTKTQVSTRTAVIIVVVALAALGFAAYGYGFGLMPRLRSVSLTERIKKPTPSESSSNIATSPKPDVTKAMFLPTNKPFLTMMGNESAPILTLKEGGEEVLYSFKLDSVDDPKANGAIQARQLVFTVSINKGLSLHSFYLNIDNNKLSSKIIAVRKTNPATIFDIGKSFHPNPDKNQLSADAITGYPKTEGDIQELIPMDEFYVIVEEPTYLVSKSGGSIIQLIARISGVTGMEKQVIETNLYGKTVEPPYGGYLLTNRDYVLNPAIANITTKAAGGIFYLIHNDPPVDTEPKNVHPDYLNWCPTIWTDSSAKNHSIMTGQDGGTRDWFCLNGLLGTRTIIGG
ncbi:hypothetical protein KKF59_03740 [Patescibacteria group bacterium]|nr:hypothetical protein [Patescibacteria group bacterium]MBU1034708.1 hypothetical protein [Patescibacteria group bacterium]MBU1629642.1 hypothetical protein [Patescibacteria group bacterium]MBU1908207.1 hypothetical protein [Patescibacteria group bacterium]